MKRLILLGLLLSGQVLAAGEYGVSPGPLTALKTFPPAAALQQRRAQVPEVTVMPRQWTTAEGLRVRFLPATDLPMLDLRLVFDAGAARDGDLHGLAAAVSSLMDEGTRQRDADAVARGFESVGAQFSASSLRDMATLQLRVLTDPARLQPALDLFAEVAAEPAFDPAAWARLRDSLAIGQRQRLQSPSGRAGQLFQSRLYGNHPYAHPVNGTASTLARIDPPALRDFHARHYTAGNGVLVLVGNLDQDAAERLAADISRRLPQGAPPAPLPPVQPLSAALRVDQPFAAQQTHVLIGQVGIRRGDPDHFPLMIANELLAGGGFGSLLMRELREQRGLTYGVSSSFQPMREAGPFQISFSTRADQAEQALALTRDLLARFVAQGPSVEDVKRATDSLVQSFPRGLSGNGAMAGYLAMMGFYDLPANYLTTFTARLRAVTPDQVREALQRHLHPDRLLVVTVGPAPQPAVTP